MYTNLKDLYLCTVLLYYFTGLASLHIKAGVHWSERLVSLYSSAVLFYRSGISSHQSWCTLIWRKCFSVQFCCIILQVWRLFTSKLVYSDLKDLFVCTVLRYYFIGLVSLHLKVVYSDLKDLYLCTVLLYYFTGLASLQLKAGVLWSEGLVSLYSSAVLFYRSGVSSHQSWCTPIWRTCFSIQFGCIILQVWRLFTSELVYSDLKDLFLCTVLLYYFIGLVSLHLKVVYSDLKDLFLCTVLLYYFTGLASVHLKAGVLWSEGLVCLYSSAVLFYRSGVSSPQSGVLRSEGLVSLYSSAVLFYKPGISSTQSWCTLIWRTCISVQLCCIILQVWRLFTSKLVYSDLKDLYLCTVLLYYFIGLVSLHLRAGVLWSEGLVSVYSSAVLFYRSGVSSHQSWCTRSEGLVSLYSSAVLFYRSGVSSPQSWCTLIWRNCFCVQFCCIIL